MPRPGSVLPASVVPAQIDDLDEAIAALGATGDDFARLLDRASAMRDEGLRRVGRPGVITYSRKVFVPLTTLCRDRCHYCTFVDTPAQLMRKGAPLFLSDEQILRIARAGRELGCREALLTLGDRPEERWPQARQWLDEHGFASTLDYVARAARLITEHTGLLAHANPGVMSADELGMLREVAPSMGMMLETTSRDLFERPGGVHYGSRDKDPAVRLAVLEDAGRARIPFTSGILVGIGETLADRAASLFALRDVHRRHGHLQEVIVQNFRAKPRTAMRDAMDPSEREYAAAIAVARLVLGPEMRIQAPPNLTRLDDLALLVRAGVDDWGGVSPLTADHVNPERPWPQLDELAMRTRACGYELTERLTAHPEYVQDAAQWIDPALHGAVTRLAGPDGLAATGAAVDQDARVPEASARRAGAAVADLVDRAAIDPGVLDDREWEILLRAEGAELEQVVAAADELRRLTVGEAVSIVVNRNLTSTGLRAHDTGRAGEFTLAEVGEIARDAVALGTTELCVQGRLPDGEDPSGYLEIVHAVRRAAPALHLHAFRPQDIDDLATRGGLGVDAALEALVAAGVGTFPGTGVKVLSERVRRLVAPEDLGIDRWVEIVVAAHRRGLRSTSVLFYGHVETSLERIAHLRLLREIQRDTGGFTEFVPIPLPGHGVPLVPGRSPRDEHRAMVAVSRLLLGGSMGGSIRNLQIPWTRHGVDLAAELLRCGGNDLGGTLLDGGVRPDAGVEQGLELPVAAAARLAGRVMRPLRVRATDYADAGHAVADAAESGGAA